MLAWRCCSAAGPGKLGNVEDGEQIQEPGPEQSVATVSTLLRRVRSSRFRGFIPDLPHICHLNAATHHNASPVRHRWRLPHRCLYERCMRKGAASQPSLITAACVPLSLCRHAQVCITNRLLSPTTAGRRGGHVTQHCTADRVQHVEPHQP